MPKKHVAWVRPMNSCMHKQQMCKLVFLYTHACIGLYLVREYSCLWTMQMYMHAYIYFWGMYMYGVQVLRWYTYIRIHGLAIRWIYSMQYDDCDHAVRTQRERERERESMEKVGIGVLYLKIAPRKRPTLIIAQGIRCTKTHTHTHNTFLPPPLLVCMN